jgi:ABC-2 type transport system permease protein
MADSADNTVIRGASRRTRLSGWVNNPVTVKELRGRMRGRRAFAVLTLYLIALSGIVALVYLVYVSGSSTVGSTAARTAGKGVFAAVVAVQVFMVLFIAPAFTAGAISGERERQTFELLRTTVLTAKSFVWGKLLSALSYVFLLILVSIPIQSIAFLLGGLSIVELVISQVLILVAAVTYALFGLWCSASMRTTLAATVTTFAGVLFVTFGIPLLIFSAALVLAPISGTAVSVAPFAEALLFYGGLLLAAINLPATLVVSEIILLNQDTLFFFSHFIGSLRLWLFSPWPLFILLHLAAAVALFAATVRRVSRGNDS